MDIKRRDFLKKLTFGGLTVATAIMIPNTKKGVNSLFNVDNSRPYEQWNDENAEWMMIIDLAACDGCIDKEIPRCTSACIEGHYTPDDVTWIKVFEVVQNEFSEKTYFPRPCQQCIDPPCVHICPVGAAWQRDGDKLTLVDHKRCIGCRLCMAACPYDARFFFFEDNPNSEKPEFKRSYEAQMPFGLVKTKGVTSKCEFCGLQYVGQLPHCVKSCHTGALFFGNIKENAVTNSLGVTHKIDELIKERGGYRWREEEGTYPRVFYLPESSSNGGI